MVFTVDLSAAAEVPWWAWLAAGLVLWYSFAAAVVRWSRMPPAVADPHDPAEEQVIRFFFWLLSPAAFPLLLLWLGAARFTGAVLMSRRKS